MKTSHFYALTIFTLSLLSTNSQALALTPIVKFIDELFSNTPVRPSIPENPRAPLLPSSTNTHIPTQTADDTIKIIKLLKNISPNDYTITYEVDKSFSGAGIQML